jgi:hypothetical protein
MFEDRIILCGQPLAEFEMFEPSCGFIKDVVFYVVRARRAAYPVSGNISRLNRVAITHLARMGH